MPLGLHDRLRIAAKGRTVATIAARTGLPTETVRRYMSGRTPSVEFLVRFCIAFRISCDWLLVGRGAIRLEGDEVEIDESSIEWMTERVDALRRTVEQLERRAQAVGGEKGDRAAGKRGRGRASRTRPPGSGAFPV